MKSDEIFLTSSTAFSGQKNDWKINVSSKKMVKSDEIIKN